MDENKREQEWTGGEPEGTAGEEVVKATEENAEKSDDAHIDGIAREYGPNEDSGEITAREPGEKNFFEMIYGVLFDPVETFRRVAAAPPLGRVLLVYALVSVLGALMGYYFSSRVLQADMYRGAGIFSGAMGTILPLIIFGGLLVTFVKWFVYSGLLHLVAELFGGSGRAVGVLAVTGLASLPALLFIPFELLLLLAAGEGPAATIVSGLFSLGSAVWGFVLVVLGIREVHGITTGRALAVALTPALALIALSILFILGIVLLVTAMAPLIEGSF
ncbi:hypothetical protein DCCM_4798 [Desulfocucumis palustris]|uniref:Yip1 domain-containing protein n=1 Tax=Desulfocucumis palustris TaxID=1898651 RepID=A0A2L2XH23_9FIRM|nr:Yip1 family protein [Desulfocucumis palustris]GBF35669.1 hypothetical protein DCCM_4798 [Desulfocucumis palustris]